MSDAPDFAEAQRVERIRQLMDKARIAEQETTGVSALVGGTFEVSVVGLPAPDPQATVLAIDAGMVLLRYADQEQSRYWVPLVSIQWLKINP